MDLCGREVEDCIMYFILMEGFPMGTHVVKAGSLCCASEDTYLQRISGDQSPHMSLSVTVIGETDIIEVDFNDLEPLTRPIAALLLAVPDPTERLNCFLERGPLELALRVEPGQQVNVTHEQKIFPALVHFVGNILDTSTLIPPVYFGVELKGEGEGRGQNDGTYKGVTFFSCKKNSGLFLPFNKIHFPESLLLDHVTPICLPIDTTGPVKSGDKVAFYIEDTLKKGIVVITDTQESDGCVEVLVDDGAQNELLKIPLASIMKEELSPTGGAVPGAELKRSVSSGGNIRNNPDAGSLGISSMVQIQYSGGELVYGIIRWVGLLPDTEGMMAGVELEEDKGITNGSWKGCQYFQCPPKRGIFVKLKACQPDTRFLASADSLPKDLEPETPSRDNNPDVMEKIPPPQGARAVDILEGRMKGIQGHCNSCYMDAALFSLFSCSSILDSLLYKPSSAPNGNIQRILREDIVNPLRKNGFVSARSVMVLRHQLMEESQCPSFTTSEKDPEEFLNLIMQRILGMEPLLMLQSEGQKVQDCFCYQIFIEKQPQMTVPSVQQLLEHSFHHSTLKLAQIPSCFIIQTPRFGKEYKMFSKIVPSLELDITDLLYDSPRECVVCGQLATMECADCFKDVILSGSSLKQYCDVCSKKVHSHHKRKCHALTPLVVPESFLQEPGGQRPSQIPRETLELFAVLCIETSHYVSFVKYGPEKGSWMFFDSMADRHGNEDGYNIPTVSLCPEVATYLASPLKELADQNPRDMKGVAKRLFCDAYMFMYQSKRMALYK
ncbi:ubiquitin carboxyl-terminal hydrolase CYLD [Xenopus laevis]|nr:ubiquitin carboxyl-terminal hydrolase CYLD [Xenopus laevis]XP_018123787.1 ubiquitin carboxyl-terminal hydrolase CYLD [Xenopus laevis]